MRHLPSRNDHPRRRIGEPDARRHPHPDARRIHAPRDIRSRNGEDTRARASGPIRAVIGVENRGARSSTTRDNGTAIATIQRRIPEIRREDPVALAHRHPDSRAEFVLPVSHVVALTGEIRRVSHPRPLRHIVRIRDAICGRPGDRPDEGQTHRHPQRRARRIRAICDTIDGIEEGGFGTDDGGPVDAVGRICERVGGSIRTGHPVSVDRGPGAAISVGDGADGRGSGRRRTSAGIRHRPCAVILVIGHRIDPHPAAGVVRCRGNRAAIFG